MKKEGWGIPKNRSSPNSSILNKHQPSSTIPNSTEKEPAPNTLICLLRELKQKINDDKKAQTQSKSLEPSIVEEKEELQAQRPVPSGITQSHEN